MEDERDNALRQNSEYHNNAHQLIENERPLDFPIPPKLVNAESLAVFCKQSDEYTKQEEEYSKKFSIISESFSEQFDAINKKYYENREIIHKQLDEAEKNGGATFQHVPSSMNTQTHSRPITYITIKYDPGYGNSLSICGSGPKMNWDPEKAVPLRCVGNDIWIYETSETFEEFNFKILLNNKTWEDGSDHFIHRNNPVQITPHFPS
jgi:hypothetical protein